MPRDDADIVEPYPGWPACVWLVRLKPRGARLVTPTALRAVARGIDAALHEPDTPQLDADPPRIARHVGFSRHVEREPWMPRFNGDMPRMAPLEERYLLSGTPGYETVAPWRPRAIGHGPRAAEAHALARPPLTPWRWRLLAFVFLPDMLHLLLGAPVETDATSVSYRLHRRIAEHLLPRGQARAAPYGQAAQIPTFGASASADMPTPSPQASPRASGVSEVEPRTESSRTPSDGMVQIDAEVPQPVSILPKKLRLARKNLIESARLWAHVDDSPENLPTPLATRLTQRDLHRLPVLRGYAWHPQQWWWSSYHEYTAPDPMQRPGIPIVSPLRPDLRRSWLNDHTFDPAPFDEHEFHELSRRRQRLLDHLSLLAQHAPNPNTRVQVRRRLRDAQDYPAPPPRIYGPNDPLDGLPLDSTALPEDPNEDTDADP